MATVNKEMTIQELLEVDDGISDILLSSGMHCLGCIMASGEDLAQACAVHGIDSDALIDQINEYLKTK